ncbi:MAG: DNA polymerase III subunit beta [Hydrogenophilus thermoluteolus]|uniref:DNA polymerase III subunit beta n=1 Tax=Hydrogenophilus TaxID=70774 RepID=UPI000EBC82A2|nr:MULTISPECIES: DNA polymerase III subunit beta [Hydrogenophilus]HCO77295.1 DNA polymerase III subunit beta [Rhodocyclaceae bacterium]MBW7656887.1 DNA polymerase III subunit beta [Hydrogenophilus thermoluteolus]GLW60506.1 DNA polymerase III subunit beta [Hydrogenophilus thermoluteolus]HNQ47921.1 DNA polymerase III subunit beta [Hydrogenophilus thermoluteolus]HNU19697.1 DNA polymerase III subunit beta [Hydrogenophilus thermoluteolus]
MLIRAPRDTLLTPLAAAAGIVEKRQTKPILGCFLLERSDDGLTVTATDLEAQIVVRQPLGELAGENGACAVPAKKLLDILKSLPDGAEVQLLAEENTLKVTSGRSRFTLHTLPAHDFPRLTPPSEGDQLTLTQHTLRRLVALTAFAMAQQDVRYYLNGLFFHLHDQNLHVVATDGHRLAHVEEAMPEFRDEREAILPRKTVLELQRLLSDSDQPVAITIAERQVVFTTGAVQFTSKIIEGKFPDYRRVIPMNHPVRIVFDRVELLRALQRVAVLAEDKLRPIKLTFETGLVRISGHNVEREEAVEEIEIHYEGAPLEIGFNVSYLIDVLTALTNEVIHIQLKDSMAAALITTPDDEHFHYVVMPMRL